MNDKPKSKIGNPKSRDILAQEPSLWELCDILYDVKWKLSYQVWNLQALGQTDFSEIIALWAEALDEFKAAAVSSFEYWNEIMNVEVEDDETLSNALELEKSLKSVAGAIENATDDEARKHLRAAGERIMELAKSIDILPEDSAAASAPQIPEADETEELRKRAEDAETRVAKLEAKLDEANGNLEIAKAGLKANRFRICDFGFWIGRTAADRTKIRLKCVTTVRISETGTGRLTGQTSPKRVDPSDGPICFSFRSLITERAMPEPMRRRLLRIR